MDAATPVQAAVATRRFAQVPGPKGVPVLGNALQIQAEAFHRQLEAWSAEFGDTFRVTIAGRKFLAITDPATIATVLRQRPGVFLKGPRLVQVAKELGFHGVFTADGDAWRRQRQLVMAGLDPSHLKAYLTSIVAVTESLRDRWLVAAREGREIDLLADLMRYTVDVTTSLAFGLNMDTLRQESESIQQHLNVVFPTLFRRVLAPVDVERWLPRRELKGHVDALRKAVQGFIAQARQQLRDQPELAARPRNLLQALVTACDTDGKLSDGDLAGNVLTMLLAGEDTTANTLGWLTWLLHGNPQEWATARAEVDAAIGAGRIPGSLEQLASLDFVEAAANEALRLKPVAPMMIFLAGQDAVVGDVALPKGAFVICVMRPAGLDAARFEEPQAFLPQRWLHGDEGGGAAGMLNAKRVVMPFGAGPRVCPGRYLALAEIKMVMAMLLANFDIAELSAPAGGPAERLSLTMSPTGLKVRLVPRAAPQPAL